MLRYFLLQFSDVKRTAARIAELTVVPDVRTKKTAAEAVKTSRLILNSNKTNFIQKAYEMKNGTVIYLTVPSCYFIGICSAVLGQIRFEKYQAICTNCVRGTRSIIRPCGSRTHYTYFQELKAYQYKECQQTLQKWFLFCF